ncbi:hypothetical protein E3P86_01308 [Wallemia ichthyophaga]|uniref:Seipin n=1 Tax=Wallemia ichthyophaga TaxID=245174 RepID=A0A4T0J8V7_WALIC|nr:hypothetical protein E3P86_01308 [Wallemia ichthyophaga]
MTANAILSRILNSRLLRWLLRVAVFFIITYLSIISAVLSFSSFRWYIVPSRGWSVPVHLQYGCVSTIHRHRNTKLIPFSVGKVPFDTISIPTQKVSADQSYDITLEMHIPNSINNLNLGNFMITLELENTFSSELVTSKPALLTWQHPSVITSILYKNTQTMKIPLSTQILKPSTRSLRQMTITAATVTVGRQDWIGTANNTLPQKELHVYDAALLFNIRLAGLSWLLVAFPISSFIIFTALSFVSIWSVAMLVWCGTRQPKQLEENLETPQDTIEDGEETAQQSIDDETLSESATLDGQSADPADSAESVESFVSSPWHAYDSSESEDSVETPTASTPERSLTPSNLRHRTGRDYRASDEDNDNTNG